MADLEVVEMKAFVPARDFELSKQFYQDLGFQIAWCSEELCQFCCGDHSFLLQNFYVAEHANNFMMHLLVRDADEWWNHIQQQRLGKRYKIHLGPPEDRPWGIRDLTLTDPTGVLWRIGHALE